MKKKLQPPGQREERQGINRREMVQRLMGGAAGGLIAPAVAVAHPHAPAPAAVPTAVPNPSAETWDPLFLDPHQAETLTVLAERIVPGSKKAGVTRFVDLLLSVDTRERQERFVASLSAMDGESLRRDGRPFKDLSETRQNELLTIASTPGRPQPSGHESASPSGSAEPAGMPLSILNEHFENLKSWISKAYYSSEAGMKELGWTGSYFFPSFPGCEHRSHET